MDNQKPEAKFKINITTEIKLDKPKGHIIHQAIKPETEVHISDRSQTTIELLDLETIKLIVQAQDYVSAKAAINAFGRWIDLNCKVLAQIDKYR